MERFVHIGMAGVELVREPENPLQYCKLLAEAVPLDRIQEMFSKPLFAEIYELEKSLPAPAYLEQDIQDVFGKIID